MRNGVCVSHTSYPVFFFFGNIGVKFSKKDYKKIDVILMEYFEVVIKKLYGFQSIVKSIDA